MPFDWDQYQPEGKSFDWDQFEKHDDGNVQTPSVSAANAALRGAVQTGTLGFRDELAGLLASPTGAAKVAAEKLGADYSSDPDAKNYRDERDASRALDSDAEKAQPGSYLAGQLGGAVALPLAAGAALPAGAAAGLGAGGSLVGALGAGALSGLGTSKAESAGGAAADAAAGAALGGAAFGVGKALPSVAQKGADWLGEKAAPAADLISKLAKATETVGEKLPTSEYSKALGDLGSPVARRLVNTARGALHTEGDNAIGAALKVPVQGALGVVQAGKIIGDQLLDSETVNAIAPKLGKYGKILLDAAERSPKSLAATHFLLGKTDEGYREAFRKAMGEGN